MTILAPRHPTALIELCCINLVCCIYGVLRLREKKKAVHQFFKSAQLMQQTQLMHFSFLPSLRECVLKCNFFNIIPRTREKKIPAAH